tara:strand:+ start:7687 stop:9855 length:2169 start_codon:yes stop_codon:yes gene_type:complete
MGLLDLKTDLRSLKFGRDRLNGGSSNQPYIQKSIPDELSPTSPDFLLRNGTLSRDITDSSRLLKFFKDTKSLQGTLFTAKQELLSRQNPIVQGQPNRREPGKALYNPLNTILQVGGGGIGLHTEKQGLIPIFNDREKYFTAVKDLGGPNSNNSDANRLVLIYKKKIQDLDPLTSEGSSAFQNYKINDNDPNILFSYGGGASGLGSTNIKIYDRTISDQNRPQGKDLKIYQVGRAPFYGRGGLKPGANGLNFLGASADYFTYSDINGEAIPDPSNEEIEKLTGINKSGGQTKHYGPSSDNSTLSTDEKGLNLKEYQARRPSPILNFKNNLGASIRENLTDAKIGINDEGQQITPYGPSDNNSTLSKNNKGKNLKNYQARRPTPNLNLKKNLGASIKENLTEEETGINNEGQQITPYGPQDDNSTLSKDNKFPNLKTYQTGLRNTGNLNFKGSLGASMAQSLTDSQTGVNSTNNQRLPNTKIGVTNVSQSLAISGSGRDATLPGIFDNRTILGVNGEEITKLPSYRTYKIKDPVTTNVNSSSRSEEVEGKQIIKFFFELLNNDAAGTSEFLYFRAYIDSLSDNFKSDWGKVKYSGRAENFYQYNGFERDISLGFSIVAQRPDDLPSIYTKLNTLAGVCAPDYSDIGYMRGNMIRITIGDYIKSLPCVVTGFNIDGLIGNGNWGLGEDEQVPRYLKISGMNLLPIHDFVPERGAQFFNVPSLATS